MMRLIVSVASSVCRVENTRCPVSAASNAVSIVSYEAALRAASNVDEFKLKVQGISTTADMSRDQMAQGITTGKSPEITRFTN